MTQDTVWHHGQWFRIIVTLLGMVVIVFINIQFKNLLQLFGFCGGWGISFVRTLIFIVLFNPRPLMVLRLPNTGWDLC